MTLPLLLALPAFPALLGSGDPPALTLIDVTLGDASQGGTFDLAIGHAVKVVVSGEPGSAVLLAASPTPPPDPPPVIGGVPLGVDPASFVLLVNGLADPSAVVGPDGTFALGTVVPGGLAPGSPLYLQALTVSPSGVALTPGLAATVVEALVFDFEGSFEGFATDFTDYTEAVLPGIDPQSGLAMLPAPLDPNESALRISFTNTSDDVFFFLKRRIDGLTPSAPRALRIDVRFASTVPVDSVGIGGSPGASVIMKAGGATVEPVPVSSSVPPFYVTINIDKGDQEVGGEDARVIGNIGTPPGVWEWTLLENRMTEPLAVTADETGALWICVGVDSGFEGLTEVYYDRIVVKLLD